MSQTRQQRNEEKRIAKLAERQKMREMYAQLYPKRIVGNDTASSAREGDFWRFFLKDIQFSLTTMLINNVKSQILKIYLNQ